MAEDPIEALQTVRQYLLRRRRETVHSVAKLLNGKPVEDLDDMDRETLNNAIASLRNYYEDIHAIDEVIREESRGWIE